MARLFLRSARAIRSLRPRPLPDQASRVPSLTIADGVKPQWRSRERRTHDQRTTPTRDIYVALSLVRHASGRESGTSCID